MATLESLGTVLSADLLIVGGGIAGLACAIRAKEVDPEVDVLVLDKVVSGWGGKANKGGGNIVFMDPADGIDTFLDFHLHNVGEFLEDQELLRDFANESRGNLERLESWGVHIYRDEAGEPKYVRWLPEQPWRMAVLDQDLTLNMAKHARQLGVRFRDRVEIVDLLKDGDARLRRRRLRHARGRVHHRAGRRRRAGQRQPVLQADAALVQRRR